jgi:hypothetical protein
MTMKKIHIRYIYFYILILSGSFAHAQTYSIVPNDTVETVAYLEDLEILSIQQVNNSSGPITLRWQKVSAIIPPNWDAAVCDNVLCYPDLANSGTMNPVNTGSSAYLLMHITSHVNYGTAIIRYAVWDENFPTYVDTLTYIMHVFDPTGLSGPPFLGSFDIYPNPANDFVFVSPGLPETVTIHISNTAGELVYAESVFGDQGMNISHLSKGIYFITAVFENKKIVKKLVIE